MLTEPILVPVMVVTLLAALICGYPVAYTLGGVSMLFALVGMAAGVIEPSMLAAMPLRVVGIMGNFTLLAIPAFVFMGAMLEKSGMAERLLETMGRLLSRLRGGLALAVVLVGTLLAATIPEYRQEKLYTFRIRYVAALVGHTFGYRSALRAGPSSWD